MLEMIQQLVDDARSVLREMSRTQQLAILSLGIIVGSLMLFAAFLGSDTEKSGMVPLPITVEAAGAKDLLDSIDNEGYGKAEFRPDGKIYVPIENAEKALLLLAQNNLLPKDAEVGFMEMFSKLSGWSTREDTRRMMKIARQNEVAKIIEHIGVVADAKVIYSDDGRRTIISRPGKQTAAVIVTTKLGKTLTKEVADTIIRLVAASKSGLDPKNVRVTDQTGKQYRSEDPNSSQFVHATQMEAEKARSVMIRDRIEDVCRSFIPGCIASAAVDIRMDFNKKEIHTNEILEGQATHRKTEKVKSVSSKGGSDAPGVTGNVVRRTNDGGSGSVSQNSQTETKTSDVTIKPGNRETIDVGTPKETKRSISVILQLPYEYRRGYVDDNGAEVIAATTKDGKPADWLYEMDPNGSAVIDENGYKVRKRFSVKRMTNEMLDELKGQIAVAAGINDPAEVEKFIEISQVDYPPNRDWIVSAPATTMQLIGVFKNNAMPIVLALVLLVTIVMVWRQASRALPAEEIDLPLDMTAGLDRMPSMSEEDQRNAELEAIRTKVADAVAEDPRKAANLVRRWMTKENY